MCLFFSVFITFILSIHYYLQNLPFLPVLIGQYVITIGLTVLGIWIAGHFTDEAPTAYGDRIYSVTIPFIVGALIYYVSFFRQIRKANAALDELNKE